MLRALVCPDKFRGSIDAATAARAIARGLERAGYDDIAQLPMADGGEGTLDAMLAAVGGSLRTTRVTGPLGDPVDAQWAVLSGGIGLIEMARASGHGVLPEGERDALRASTRGTGELIAAARRAGCREIIVGVGGSATTDGGLAAVEALGWALSGTEVTVACDVTTPFLDAARVYGPQKGASDAEVGLLTRRLALIAAQYRDRTGVDVTGLVGAGAAGGLAGGLAAIGARIEPGFEVLARAVDFEARLDGVDLLVTGEGRLDATSLEGKVVGAALDIAAECGVARRAVVCGRADDDARATLEADGVIVLTLLERAWDADDAYTRAELLAEEAAATLSPA